MPSASTSGGSIQVSAFAWVMAVPTAFVLWSLVNSIVMFGLSRVSRGHPDAGETFRFVFVIPALNEGRVIAATVLHLLEIGAREVLVIDDGSEDDTASELRAIRDPRLDVLARVAPRAREGKGAALNAAYQRILDGSGPWVPSDRIVLCVIDADGRLDPGATAEAEAAFRDPKVGACQVAVGIRNRGFNLLTRMQHFESVAYSFLYQRGREWTGSVGLGGNGQFVRVSALQSLGAEPWSACLAEDMDLGIRLTLHGWRSRFLSSGWVSQQGIPEIGRLMRQRTRWFQGTLQCCSHLRAVLTSPSLSIAARADLAGMLLAPLVMLAVSPLLFLGAIGLVAIIPAMIAGVISFSAFAPAYALALITPMLLAFVYWRHERGKVSIRVAIVTGHLFALYGFFWPIVGWRAVYRQIWKRNDWVRTERIVEPAAARAA